MNENESGTNHSKQNESGTSRHIQKTAWKLFCKALKTNESFFTHPEKCLYSGNIESDTQKGKQMTPMQKQMMPTDAELEYMVSWYRHLGDSIYREGREDLGLDIRYAAEVIELLWQERKQG